MPDPTVTINVFANTAGANAAMATTATNIRGLGASAATSTGGVKGLGSSIVKLGGSLAAMAAAFGAFRLAAGSVRSLIGTNKDFEESMAQTRAVTMQNAGFTEDAFKSMSEEARRLGATTRFSASDAADGLKFLGMAGFTARQSMESLAATLQLAQAGSLDLGTSADIVSNIMSAFGADTDQTQKFVDVLAKTAATSNNSVFELGDSMKYAAPIAAGLGKEVHEAAAAFGVLGSRGVKASMSGAGLRMVLSQLADEGGPAVKALRELGVTYDEIDPKANSLVTVFSNLASKGVDVKGVFSAFDARAANVAQILVQNSDSLDDFTQSLTDSTGAAADMASVTDDTFGGSVDRAKSAWKEFMLTLGDSGIMSGLRGLMDNITGAIGSMITAVKVLQEAFNSGDLAAMFALALKIGAMRGVNFLLSGMLTAFRVAVAYLGGVFEVITSLDYWQGLYDVFLGAGKVLLGVGAQFSASLLDAARPFVEFLTAGLSFVTEKLKSGFIIIGTTLVDLITAGIQKTLEGIDGLFGLADFSDEIDELKDFRRNAQESRSEATDSLTRGFGSHWDEAETNVGSWIADMNEAGKNLVSDGSTQVGEGFGNVTDLIGKEVVGSMVDAARESQPVNVFGGMVDDANSELDKLWADNLPDMSSGDKDEDATNTLDSAAEDLASSSVAQRDSSNDSQNIVTSSLQSIGGGGGVFGAAQSTLEESAAKTANATERVAANTEAIATGQQSSGQLSLLQSILEVLRNIRDATGSGSPEIQVS